MRPDPVKNQIACRSQKGIQARETRTPGWFLKRSGNRLGARLVTSMEGPWPNALTFVAKGYGQCPADCKPRLAPMNQARQRSRMCGSGAAALPAFTVGGLG